MTIRRLPKLTVDTLIETDEISRDPQFKGLRIIRADQDGQAYTNLEQKRYAVQHQTGYTELYGILALKGAEDTYRVTLTLHPTMSQFCKLVKYDPSDPPAENYQALQMAELHKLTQSDFRGEKKANLGNYKDYIVEAMRGPHVAYLPTIAGWQTRTAFDGTVFAALHELAPGVLYGLVFLPDKPIMQADGQTQTAALFRANESGYAVETGKRDRFNVTLEVELGMDEVQAGQSFADRNGRGTKKNRNLVAKLDVAGGLARLREQVVPGTIFEGRLHGGRNSGVNETAVENIIDLSTLEQLLLIVISNNARKPEHIKAHHVAAFLPFCKDFLKLLEDVFGAAWPRETPEGQEPYRRLYVHGWPFALKAIAHAYHQACIEELGPLAAAIREESDNEATVESAEAFLARAEENKRAWAEQGRTAPLDRRELERRLRAIDWHRWRRHWVEITGYTVDENGNKKPLTLKDGTVVVRTKSPNTAATIGTAAKLIVSPGWEKLCGSEDEPLD